MPKQIRAHETRFHELQRKSQDASQAEWQYTLQLTLKYGAGNTWRASTAERRRRDVLDRAARRAWDRYFTYLTAISPRDWSSRVPVSWIRDSLSYSDAITAGRLSVVPPPAYGCNDRELEAFAQPVQIAVRLAGLS